MSNSTVAGVNCAPDYSQYVNNGLVVLAGLIALVGTLFAWQAKRGVGASRREQRETHQLVRSWVRRVSWFST